LQSHAISGEVERSGGLVSLDDRAYLILAGSRSKRRYRDWEKLVVALLIVSDKGGLKLGGHWKRELQFVCESMVWFPSIPSR
jgi:hypothetical protein